jgi:CRISPR-associated endonuclease/helicase Cas3
MTTPRVWPSHLDYLLAKSADKGAGGKPETLAEHTYSVLEKLAANIHLRPALPGQIGVPRLWHILFWAAFLHDFGKAAKGFQARLKSKDAPRWTHRHEVLSLAFVDWIVSAFEREEQHWLIAAIVSHHRDAAEIAQLYNTIDRAESAFSDELDTQTIGDLWKWLAECPLSWIETLGLSSHGIDLPTLPPQTDAVSIIEHNIPTVVRKWLNVYQRWVEKDVNRSDEARLLIGTMLLRGHLISSDHMASAHVGELPEPQLSNPDQIIAKLKLDKLYDHQRECMNVLGSTVLMAPTGSGKTEAALLWAVSQGASRLYYTLPFQASMNAMEKRLNEDEKNERGEVIREAPFKNQVGLEHSRSLLAYYRRLLYESENANPEQATKAAKWLKNLAELNYYPVRVLSPYQLLKAPYRLKGYETLLTDCYGAAFIFDEIHAYEAARLAKILALVKHLRENYNAKFLVMSATLPKILRESLNNALGDYALVTASDDLYREFRRHELVLRDGELLSEENLGHIADIARGGQTVLVCCNTISRAQTAWRELGRRLDGQIRVELLHGKFNGKDRLEKEQIIRVATGSRSTARVKSIVLVATQVVEVSLDIDLDTIFTDPAPLEALLQRFGRVNRRRKKGIVPVCVFREPIPEKPRPYEPELIRAALDILEEQNGNQIDEAQVSAWLDRVYERPEVAKPWLTMYQREYREFTETALMNLRAFQSDDALEDLFYQAFESVDILPEDLYAEYLDAREQSPIEASQLLVPLHYTMFGRLKSEGRGYTDEEGKLKLVKVYYDSEVGLDLNRQSREKIEDW